MSDVYLWIGGLQGPRIGWKLAFCLISVFMWQHTGQYWAVKKREILWDFVWNSLLLLLIAKTHGVSWCHYSWKEEGPTRKLTKIFWKCISPSWDLFHQFSVAKWAKPFACVGPSVEILSKCSVKWRTAHQAGLFVLGWVARYQDTYHTVWTQKMCENQKITHLSCIWAVSCIVFSCSVKWTDTGAQTV